jgi:hypothetical protein
MDYDGANVAYLTDSSSIVLAPRFSPTGNQILFTSYESGFPRIYLMDEPLSSLDAKLRADFDASHFAPEARTILSALQRYGMIVADNGIEWAISVTPDERIPALHDELRRIRGSDFEVVTAPRKHTIPTALPQLTARVRPFNLLLNNPTSRQFPVPYHR